MDKFLKISEIKKDIKGGKEVCTRKCIYMKLPRKGAHSNHPIKSVSSLFHCAQPRIVDCISYCVDIGVTTRSNMKWLMFLKMSLMQVMKMCHYFHPIEQYQDKCIKQ